MLRTVRLLALAFLAAAGAAFIVSLLRRQGRGRSAPPRADDALLVLPDAPGASALGSTVTVDDTNALATG